MKALFNNFFRGLLLVFPLSATIYIVYALVDWANESLNTLIFEPFSIDIPGLGILTVFLGVTLLGYICTRAFIRPLVTYFERLISKLPLVKIIYTSIKELTEAFVGEKRKFNQPVIIQMNNDGLSRLGFITNQDLSDLELEGMVAVYCPHSYNFSGNLFLVERSSVTPVDLNPTEVMKYIISAGVTDIKQR